MLLGCLLDVFSVVRCVRWAEELRRKEFCEMVPEAEEIERGQGRRLGKSV